MGVHTGIINESPSPGKNKNEDPILRNRRTIILRTSSWVNIAHDVSYYNQLSQRALYNAVSSPDDGYGQELRR